ncbi:MAG: hypothetical protein IJI50_00700, partial [Ruminococcus sp.]|nr:hypothetical protein [Ruminococcus sp.]
SLNKVLAENFVERGGGRRQAGACQVRQQSYTEFSATDVKGFYLKLVSVFCHYFAKQIKLICFAYRTDLYEKFRREQAPALQYSVLFPTRRITA